VYITLQERGGVEREREREAQSAMFGQGILTEGDGSVQLISEY